jgi:MoxR-like ATPase
MLSNGHPRSYCREVNGSFSPDGTTSVPARSAAARLRERYPEQAAWLISARGPIIATVLYCLGVIMLGLSWRHFVLLHWHLAAWLAHGIQHDAAGMIHIALWLGAAVWFLLCVAVAVFDGRRLVSLAGATFAPGLVATASPNIWVWWAFAFIGLAVTLSSKHWLARPHLADYFPAHTLPTRIPSRTSATSFELPAEKSLEAYADEPAAEETSTTPAALDEDELIAKARGARDYLSKRVIGQPEAVEEISNAMRRLAMSGLRDPDRPIASFLFPGPTGVGKSEMAKALAEYLYDDPEALIQLDMSEFQEPHNVARLIGAPPGYIGSESGGQLTDAVRKRPYSVVLFDEIEKGARSVLDICLQMLNDGRLTDGKGNTTDFTNTIIIFTSNLSEAEIERNLRPEFRNRLDATVRFNHLQPEDVRQIADLLVAKKIARIDEQHSIDFQVLDSARDLFALEGYDRDLGARELKRTIDRLTAPISDEYKVSIFLGDTVAVWAEDGANELSFKSVLPHEIEQLRERGR